MAVLSDSDRASVHARWMRENTTTVGAVTKAEIRAAVNAIDDWINTNAASLNSAIPQPARGVLTQAQKALLLEMVIYRRYIAGA